MAGKTDAAETDFLELFFQNTDWPNVGDGTGLQGSGTPGVFYISLHTGDPTDTGNQTSSECAYTGYARESVARSGAGWSVSGDTADNVAAITFGEKTGGGDETATHVGIGSDLSGSGNLFMSGSLSASLSITNGVIPEFAIGALDITEA